MFPRHSPTQKGEKMNLKERIEEIAQKLRESIMVEAESNYDYLEDYTVDQATTDILKAFREDVEEKKLIDCNVEYENIDVNAYKNDVLQEIIEEIE